jgi:hypothetical protein
MPIIDLTIEAKRLRKEANTRISKQYPKTNNGKNAEIEKSKKRR